jgi:hypothetical protein
MSKHPSLLVCYGLQNYRLWEVIEEAEAHGISKRIPLTAIPEGMVQGASKIFAAHPHAIIKVLAPGKGLEDLAYALLEEGVLTQVQFSNLVDLEQPYWIGEELQPYDFVPESMLDIAMALSKSEHWRDLVKAFEIEFCMGIIGYSPFSGFQYVLGKNDEGLPPELAHLDGYLEPVRIEYVDDEGQPEESDEEDG